jgi:hypothetical protein
MKTRKGKEMGKGTEEGGGGREESLGGVERIRMG